MNELPSAQFRTQYAKLDEPTVVTVNGHAIGTWLPMSWEVKLPALDGEPFQITSQREDLAKLPAGGVQARQAQRDALLGKINRSK